jgi:hypothetical protein
MDPSVAEQIEAAVLASEDAPMPQQDELDSVLAAYGEYIGVPGLAFDATGVAALTVEQELEVAFVHLPRLPGLVLMARFDSEVAEQASLLKMALQANLSMGQTLGGSFATIPPDGDLVYSRLMLVSGRELEAIDRDVGAFVEMVRAWQLRFSVADSGAFGVSTQPPPTLPPQFGRSVIRP